MRKRSSRYGVELSSNPRSTCVSAWAALKRVGAGQGQRPRARLLVLFDGLRHVFLPKNFFFGRVTEQVNVSDVLTVEVMHALPLFRFLVHVGPGNRNRVAYFLSVVVYMTPHGALHTAELVFPERRERIVCRRDSLCDFCRGSFFHKGVGEKMHQVVLKDRAERAP